jgi:hypothetical protein
VRNFFNQRHRDQIRRFIAILAIFRAYLFFFFKVAKDFGNFSGNFKLKSLTFHFSETGFALNLSFHDSLYHT